MLEIKKTDENTAQSVCKQKNLEYVSGVTAVMLAKDNEEIIGSCVFDISKGKMRVRDIEPNNDMIMIDSMLRSALFFAANKGISDVCYGENINSDIIERLGFMKNPNEKSIDITNLFSCCKNCDNKD